MVSLLQNLQETNGNGTSGSIIGSCGVLARRLRRHARNNNNVVHLHHGRSPIETSRRFLQRGLVSSSFVNQNGRENINFPNVHDSTRSQIRDRYQNEIEREELKMHVRNDLQGNTFVSCILLFCLIFSFDSDACYFRFHFRLSKKSTLREWTRNYTTLKKFNLLKQSHTKLKSTKETVIVLSIRTPVHVTATLAQSLSSWATSAQYA